MSVHRICIAGEPVLHRPTLEVTEFGTELKTLVDEAEAAVESPDKREAD